MQPASPRRAPGISKLPEPLARMLDLTPIFRLMARRRLSQLARLDPAETQIRTLLALVRKAAATGFGRAHDFGSIGSVGEFQACVKLRRYEDFWAEFWREPFPHIGGVSWPGTIPYFAVTSGTTTGATKYIPCSADMLRANVRASLDILTHHVARRPNSKLLGGRGFMLGGSTNLVRQAPGINSGDISGIAAAELPWWINRRYFPSKEMALITDWEEKIAKLAPASLEVDIRTISGTPSWLLVFFDKLAALRTELPHRLSSYYPNLELLIHGGVNFAPYRAQFEALLEGSRAELREVYPASEGFIAVADRGSGEGMRMLLDTGLFYEFVPVEELESTNPTRHWIGNAETGVNYALVLSSNAGVWSYVLGDTVRLVSLDPPRLLVTGRTSYMLSAFGEHLINEEIEEAVAKAAAAIGALVTDYSVGAVFPKKKGGLGHHLFIVEFADPAPGSTSLKRFTETLDADLSATNEDYQAHRAGGIGLAPPRLQAPAPGTFASWMKKRGKLGGQHKVPRIITDETLFDDLRMFAKAREVG
ncbi:MAG: GH3 auxin-responsive promoter family protein [Alphaproteobacteria bacterium]|nr:GH3 auxin-responsive promoter family protein [Alphaproteobacteria bacterium]